MQKGIMELVPLSARSTILLQAGSASPDLSTPSGSSTKQAIKMIYGHTIEKELLQTSVEDNTKSEESWSSDIYFTNPNYQAKKMIFLLFINCALSASHFHAFSLLKVFPARLVESSRIKRALENVYTGILPKGSAPFIYLRSVSMLSLKTLHQNDT